MSLPHILLGMLAEPQSGYDLKKQFGESLQHFWHAELSQIYPTLKRLERDGLVTSRPGESRAGPPRRVYRRSAKGRRHLLEWLKAGPVTGTERIGYMAQVFFLSEAGDDDVALEFFTQLREHMAGWLGVLQDAERQWAAGDPRYPDDLPDDAFYQQLTLALGIRKVQANLDWCEDTLARLAARQRRKRRRT